MLFEFSAEESHSELSVVHQEDRRFGNPENMDTGPLGVKMTETGESDSVWSYFVALELLSEDTK